MDEYPEDALLGRAFADLRHEVAPQVRPFGVPATRATVRRRRRTSAVLVAAAAALIILVPAGAYAVVAADRGTRPGPVGGSPAATSTGSPPAAAPPASPGATADPGAGTYTFADLKNVTLELPAWAPDANLTEHCVSGRVTFTQWAKSVAEGQEIFISVAGYADIDGDGTQETLVLVTCSTDSIGTDQVIAVRRGAGGVPVTVGQVAVQTGTIKKICAARAGAAGGVDVQVVDYDIPPSDECTPTAAPWAIFQWRSYSLVGGEFRQTGGPTAFPVNPKISHLTVTASDLVFAAPAGGVRHGTITVTVRNVGPSAMPFNVVLQLPLGPQVVTPGFTEESFPSSANWSGDFGALAAGAKREIVIKIDATDPVTPDFLPRVLIHPAAGYADPVLDGYDAQFSIVYH